MAKIMLVEDDNNLREIYSARLQAEGYEIVSAKDGEEALALAVKEKPDLIIADIMMPRISGFDMLDILRTTPETKNTKVIVMTALNQAEDKAHADQLGADRYLVKSQVTLEDVAKNARELLAEDSKGESLANIEGRSPNEQTPAANVPAQAAGAVTEPATAATAPIEATSAVASSPPAPVESTPKSIPITVQDSPNDDSGAPVSTPPTTDQQASNDQVLADAVAKVSSPSPTVPTSASAVVPAATSVAGDKVIQPLDTPPKPDIQELAAKEEAKEQGNAQTTATPINPA